jgi:hypothetical protein
MTETVTCNLPHELLVRVDDLTNDRDDFIREAVTEKLARTKQNGKSAWNALSGIAGLEVTIPKAPEKVKRIGL